MNSSCAASIAAEHCRLAATTDQGHRHREGAAGRRDGEEPGRLVRRAAASVQGTPQRRRCALAARIMHLCLLRVARARLLQPPHVIWSALCCPQLHSDLHSLLLAGQGRVCVRGGGSIDAQCTTCCDSPAFRSFPFLRAQPAWHTRTCTRARKASTHTSARAGAALSRRRRRRRRPRGRKRSLPCGSLPRARMPLPSAAFPLTDPSAAPRRLLHAVCCLMSAACCLHYAFRLVSSVVVPRCPLQLASLHAVCGTSSVPHSPRHAIDDALRVSSDACRLLHVVHFARARTHLGGSVWYGAAQAPAAAKQEDEVQSLRRPAFLAHVAAVG